MEQAIFFGFWAKVWAIMADKEDMKLEESNAGIA